MSTPITAIQGLRRIEALIQQLQDIASDMEQAIQPADEPEDQDAYYPKDAPFYDVLLAVGSSALSDEAIINMVDLIPQQPEADREEDERP